MARLWNYFGGEPYLTNPHLVVTLPGGNPKRKTKIEKYYRAVNMRLRRDSSGRFLPRGRRNAPAHRRRHRSNPPVALLGVTFPDVPTIAWTAGGFLVPPFLEGFARRFLPVDFSS